MASRLERDQDRPGDAFCCLSSRLVGDQGIVHGVDQQRRNGQLFKRIAVHIRVGNEGVEVDAFSSWGDREETVDELGYQPVVLATAREVSGHPPIGRGGASSRT